MARVPHSFIVLGIIQLLELFGVPAAVVSSSGCRYLIFHPGEVQEQDLCLNCIAT